MGNWLVIIGVMLLIVGVIGLTVKGMFSAIIPSFITDNLRYILIGGILAICMGFLGFIGLIIGAVISALIVFGGVI